MVQISLLPASGRAKRLRGLVSSRVQKNFRFIARLRSIVALFLFGGAAVLLTMTGVNRTFAAASAGCQGGGFTLLGLSGNQRGAVPAGSVPGSFLVKGKYVEFTVDAATFGVRDWTLTGVANPLDITGGRRTVVFASKIPDHRGVVLNGDVQINSSGGSLVIMQLASESVVVLAFVSDGLLVHPQFAGKIA